ncbi:chaperone [Lithospermum erythrorhizon]|uniref:Chaperone n=1 Tax=Lithospermum erythrorhizon TaxID=34254 RepID=A0AAV3Q4A8_LITER
MKAHHILLFPVVTDCMLSILRIIRRLVGTTSDGRPNTGFTTLTCTFRKFKEKLASQNSSSLDSKKQISEDCMKDPCANVKVGDRCQVEPGEKRGIIKFVGQAEALSPGFWVGVQYDEPLGKHDGTVKGKRYFECPPLHGAMVRPDKVKVGDYPERDPFEEEEI